MKKPATMKDVEAEVRRLERRTDGQEDTVWWMLRIQFDQLAKAEELRKLAIAAVMARGKPGPRGYTLFARRMDALEALIKDLLPFHKPRWMPAAARKLLKLGGKARG